jgi:2,4-dienoyl-CoA reductase-like NADH-dependent reductase (Old Yellow Enzyme family)
MSSLFTPLKLRSVEFRNRIFVSPMCEYSSREGLPNDWHLVHLGSRAVGGAGLVLTEASAVSPEGRISPADAGLWSGAHAGAWRQVVRFIHENGAAAGVQLAHAGRKASTAAPWDGGEPVSVADGGWQPIGPSPIAFDEGYPEPREMSAADIDRVVEQFADGARLAREAGFDVVELHAAHGYLLHEFLSPLSNHRTDQYGGTLENRIRFPLRAARAVREAWPSDRPLFVRISATDWAEGGWDLPQSIAFARELGRLGIDLVDCSSGGLVPRAKIPAGPGYQVPFAAAIRRDVGISTAAVGGIAEAKQAEAIVASGQADAVLLARQFLRDPYWPLHAARELGVRVPWPKQYERAG